MRLHSALEDLTNNTLPAVSGILAKLDYLSSLRANGGSYVHWGLASMYGEAAAQEALAQAHEHIFSKILRAPLQDLLEDLKECSRSAGVTPAAYLKKLRKGRADLVPINPGPGSAQHFSSVLYALSSLQKSRRAAIRPAS